MTKLLAVSLVALCLVATAQAAPKGPAGPKSSASYSLSLVSLTPQPDAQHYGFSNWNVSFSDGVYRQCCAFVQVVTSCDNGLTEVGGPAKLLYPGVPTPMIGLFYRWDPAPTVCHSWIERLTDHNKRQGVASPVVSFNVP